MGPGEIGWRARVRAFYGAALSTGDRLGEIFYAVWMAVISIGLLNSVDEITEDHIAVVVVTALVANLAWGIIDGVTVMLSAVIAWRKEDIAAHTMPAEPLRRRYLPVRAEWMTAVAIILLDLVVAVPIVVPLLLVQEIQTAVYVSRIVATVMFGMLGAAYARNLGWSPWLVGPGLAIAGYALFTAAYAAGW